jgi:hypothetical protein
MFTEDDIHTLVDVIISNPMWLDLFPQSCVTQDLTTFDLAQAEKMSDCN